MPTRNETTLVEELRPSDCNVSLMVADRNSTTVSVLTINSAHMERTTNFTCYAENRIGEYTECLGGAGGNRYVD